MRLAKRILSLIVERSVVNAIVSNASRILNIVKIIGNGWNWQKVQLSTQIKDFRSWIFLLYQYQFYLDFGRIKFYGRGTLLGVLEYLPLPE
jgi:hypothetical protein